MFSVQRHHPAPQRFTTAVMHPERQAGDQPNADEQINSGTLTHFLPPEGEWNKFVRISRASIYKTRPESTLNASFR